MSKAEAVRQIIQAFLSIHNDAAPIHRLPTELLSDIFTWCYHDSRSIRISHVCRRWRDVLLNTSAFWVDMLAGQPFDFGAPYAELRLRRAEFMKMLFRLSAMRGLTIRLVHYQKTFTRCLEQDLWGVGSRITSLRVNIYNISEFTLLRDTLASTMSCLEDLEILLSSPEGPDCDPGRQWYTRTNVFDEIQALPSSSIPRLKSLSASGIIFHHFTRESIQHAAYHLPRHPDFNYELLRDFLHAFSELKTLLIHRNIMSGDDDASVREFGKISLPFLHTLTIQNDRMDYTDPISNIFHLPALVHLHVLHVKSRGILPSVNNLLPAEDLELLPCLLAGVDRVDVVKGHTPTDHSADVAIRICSDDAERVRITLGHSCATVDSFVALFRPYTSITHLSIAVHNVVKPDLDPEFFRAFPGLRALRIASGDADSIFCALNAPDVAEDPRSIVVPHLKTLAVSFPFYRSESGLKKALLDESSASNIAGCVFFHYLSIRSVLAYRAARGARLERFEWSEFEYDPEEEFKGIPTAVLPWGGYRESDGRMVSLRKLVDGPVTFGTFTFWPYLTREDADAAACAE